MTISSTSGEKKIKNPIQFNFKALQAMWKTILSYFIVFIANVQSDLHTDSLPKFKCSISAEFTTALLTGLINEYKYDDIQIVYEYMDEIYTNLDKLDEDLKKSLRGKYDIEVKHFGFSTVSIRQLMNSTLKMVYLMNARPTDFNIKKIADLITNDQFGEATKLIERLDREILIYPIIEIVYKSERQMVSVEKLINFTYHYMSSTKSISKVVAMEIMMFREMTLDPDNLFTYDMIVYAELLRETISKVTTYHKHDPNQDILNKKLKFIRKSLPRMIQNLVFYKGEICIENEHWKEFLFISDHMYNNEKDKRIVYTWEDGISKNQKQWLIAFDRKKFGYTIKHKNLNEYLYSPPNNVVYDVDRRFTFTKSSLSDTSYWSFTPIDNNHFAIRNIKNNEYIYVVEDSTFSSVYQKRRVFSRRVQGDLNAGELGSQIWKIGAGCSKS